MKRTFVIPDDKMDIYLKFKAIVPEVSSKLVELMEQYVKDNKSNLWPMSLKKYNHNLDISIDQLELSVRSSNLSRMAGFKTVRDLVRLTEGELLRTGQFGRKQLNEIKDILHDLGLSFGMKGL